LKILQVNKYYNPDIGGVETVVRQYAEALAMDHDVTVLCVKKFFSFSTNSEMQNKINIIRSSSFGTYFSMPVSLSFFVIFLRIYKKFDIIHFHEPFPLASLLSLFIGKRSKIIITWHSDIVKQKLLKSTVEIFQRKLCGKAKVILATSPNLLKYSSVINSFREKVDILPLSIPIDKRVSVDDENYILYLGRLSYYKGMNVLLEAYTKARTNMDLVIVGDGEEQIVKQISNYSNTTNKKVRFINKFVSEEEKNEYFKKCSFFVLPSIEASEAFAIIQLEAMIQGKAVINTNLPTGVPFVSVNNQTGLTVTVNNVDELSQAIDKLALDNQLRKQLGINGHNRVKSNFSNDIIIEKLKMKYSSIINVIVVLITNMIFIVFSVSIVSIGNL
tara:strand:- start:617 stop:1777 length:1161 start_codon:yes stop_codon:yes gene_type:complete